jgi:parvulin-like peptidyl-prolyl isomerase
MMRALRNSFKTIFFPVMWLVIITFIGTIFYWGMGSRADTVNPGVIATVGETRILRGEYAEAYKRQEEALRRLYGDKADARFFETIQLQQQVLEDLINRVLILQEAERVGVGASEEEVIAEIKAIPAFATEGKFSRERYLDLLRLNGLTPEAFEGRIREDLLRRKMLGLIRGTAKVSEAEARAAFRTAKEQVTVEYVAFPAGGEGREAAERFLTAVRVGTPWEKATREAKGVAKKTDPFALGRPVVPEADAEPFGLAAFRLKAGQVSPIVEAVTATYVLRLLKRYAAEMSAFEKERVSWHRALLAQKEQQIFLAWLRDLRARSGVQIHDRTT